MLKYEASTQSVQCAVHVFKGNINARTCGDLRGQHLPVTRCLKFTLKLLIEKEPAEWSGYGAVVRLRRKFYVKHSTSSHHHSFSTGRDAPLDGLRNDAGES